MHKGQKAPLGSRFCIARVSYSIGSLLLKSGKHKVRRTDYTFKTT